MAISKELKAWRIANKICVRCGEGPAMEGIQKCASCRQKSRAAQDRIKAERVALGLCIDCGKPTDGTQRCSTCYGKQNQTRMELADVRREEKICTVCGTPLTAENSKEGNKVCTACIKPRAYRRNADYQQRVAQGLCGASGCPNPPRPGSKYCEEHIQRQSQRANRRYRERRAKGLCCFCSKPPKPALPGRNHCADCAAEARDTCRRVNLRRKKRIFDHYGWACSCCGLAIPSFLEIDHINGGGIKHFREIGISQFYKWLCQNNFPEGFQTLCSSCNKAKHRCGRCPHQELPTDLLLLLRQTNQTISDYWKKTYPEAYEAPPKKKGGRKREYLD